MKKLLVKFHWDCGRNGDLRGLFVTTQEEIYKHINKRVYFGEVLGKHSEVYGDLGVDDFTVISNDQDFIKKLVEVIGSERISGYCPFDYMEEE